MSAPEWDDDDDDLPEEVVTQSCDEAPDTVINDGVIIELPG